MPYHQFIWPAAVAFVVWCGGPSANSRYPAGGFPKESTFLVENDVAMTRMMNGMTVQPTGDIDQDFTAMMIAHHQGAIDMASAELRHGTNELLRRIAQGIIVDQTQEIVAMRLAAGTKLSPPGAAATGPAPASRTAAPPQPIPGHEHALEPTRPGAFPSGSPATWEFVK